MRVNWTSTDPHTHTLRWACFEYDLQYWWCGVSSWFYKSKRQTTAVRRVIGPLFNTQKTRGRKRKTNSKQEQDEEATAGFNGPHVHRSRESDCCCFLFLQENFCCKDTTKTHRKRGKRMETGGDKLNQSHRKSLKTHTHAKWLAASAVRMRKLQKEEEEGRVSPGRWQ